MAVMMVVILTLSTKGDIEPKKGKLNLIPITNARKIVYTYDTVYHLNPLFLSTGATEHISFILVLLLIFPPPTARLQLLLHPPCRRRENHRTKHLEHFSTSFTAYYKRSDNCSMNVNGVLLSRGYAQAARKDEEEEEEVEIDQRRLPADYDPATFDPTEHRSPPTERVFKLVDEVAGLTLVEVAELSSIIMKKRGMTELPTVGVLKGGAAGLAGMAMKAPAAAAKEEKKPEKTVFELKLESYEAASKIKIIKEVRSFTDLGLKEAKDLVEKTPSILKAGVSKEEAEQIIEKMKAVGAKVVME
ncbi:50S ribosomal protein L7/L12, putative [Ricinus communis]|uniref:50S ribosomal protein L7/L12, putative n=1 Tax=Ricinus communis TaxID=3988 RepID=B9T5A3_RICCO|nr:50S ribosomal protein L7/L12, putative [Ricinus communis]